MSEPKAGDKVRLRTASGGYVEAVALSGPRYDVENAIAKRGGRKRDACWLSVSVKAPAWEHPINWPAEDVEVAEIKAGR